MAEFIYNKKFYKSRLWGKFVHISRRGVDKRDSFVDKKICGTSLIRYVDPVTKGVTGSQSTPYFVLDEVFKNAIFKPTDSFIDVGCGRGRVLAYMVKKKYQCKISGVELNKDVADFTKEWAQKYENVNVICGNAFELDYNDYNVIYMGRPFEPELFHKFIEMLENTLKHPIKLYYWVEQQSGSFLDDRNGWKLHTRKRLFFKKGFFIANTPQRYSIWTFTPSKK